LPDALPSSTHDGVDVGKVDQRVEHAQVAFAGHQEDAVDLVGAKDVQQGVRGSCVHIRPWSGFECRAGARIRQTLSGIRTRHDNARRGIAAIPFWPGNSRASTIPAYYWQF